jgi:signal transduction histidine kinase
VLTNLVENELRYAPEGVIRLEVAQEALEDGGEEVRVTVADEGPGIPPSSRRWSSRVRPAPENRQSGTGLGLYITRGLVEAHGGRVWIDPDDAEGATSHVSLPTSS